MMTRNTYASCAGCSRSTCAHPFRRHGDPFLDLVKRGEVHAIDSLLKENDLLLDHRLRELVMLDQFYLGYHDQLFDKEGIRTILTDRAAHSPFPSIVHWPATCCGTSRT